MAGWRQAKPAPAEAYPLVVPDRPKSAEEAGRKTGKICS